MRELGEAIIPDMEPFIPDSLPWLQWAYNQRGVREIVGERHNPIIMGWASGLWYPDDETPWCGLFVYAAITKTLPNEETPENPLGARNWNKFGIPCQRQPGAIVTFWRGSPEDWRGHVGFYWGEDKNGFIHVLGGNQSNSVNISRIKKNRLLDARWPATAEPRSGSMRWVDTKGRPVTENEA